jgi:hypothetical protein
MNQKRRITQAIDECSRFIDREEARNAALRPADTQSLLDFYYSHRIKLLGMLEASR